MAFRIHNHRYEGRSQLNKSFDWPNMRIEQRRLSATVLPAVTCTCNAISIALAGRTSARWEGVDSVRRVVAVQPGIASILPVGFAESECEIASPVECLHIFLAPSLTAASALADFDIDPSRAEMVRTEVSDPFLKEVAAVLHEIISRPPEPTDRLFVDGASAVLAAHLISKYSNVALRASSRSPNLPYQKLKRVLDLIECRFADEIGLDELAAEACLSPFHFSRLFHKATGVSPYRYVAERRVREAKRKLAEENLSLAEIALESGFGSQGNFNRIFRKHTGFTPGQFRNLRRGAQT